jgi:DNA-binding NtrC family response regulator
MHSNCLAVIADDPALAESVEASLQAALDLAVHRWSSASARGHLGPDTDGLVILATGGIEDSEHILRLVQEISLRQWLPGLVVLETAQAAAQKDLTCLDGYINRRLRWPDEQAALQSLVKDHLRREKRLPKWAAEESLAEAVERELLCQTPSLHALVEPIVLAASYDVPLLLTGETGTGKTFLARLIHNFSSRKSQRLLVVPCGALAPNLIESEFFGHVKGAFTGADRPKEGKFAAAGSGTLLLDEIDALGLEQQANLLRVLETGEFEAVGSNQTQVCTARIIAASNRNLEEEVENGRFRQDLYYRLHVMAFDLPPLRERVQDIAPLVRGMAAQFNTKFRKGLFDISAEAMAALQRFPWPGNIRQLENVVQQAVLVSSGPELQLAHLPAAVREQGTSGQGGAGVRGDCLAHNRQETERLVIQRALANCRNCRSDAAQALGISRVTLYKKMKKYGLMAPKGQAGQV